VSLAERVERMVFAFSFGDDRRKAVRELAAEVKELEVLLNNATREAGEQKDRADALAAELKTANHWRERHSNDAQAYGVQSNKNWQRAKVLEDTVANLTTPRPRETWDEDDGPALWWMFPVSEPPYAGTPLDDDFPDYVTHWTPLPVVNP